MGHPLSVGCCTKRAAAVAITGLCPYRAPRDDGPSPMPGQARGGLAQNSQTRMLLAQPAGGICHEVLGLNYLDGLSKCAADGDTVSCAAADRPAHRIFPTGSGKRPSPCLDRPGGLAQKVCSSAEFAPHMTLIEVLALSAGVFILSCWSVPVGAVGKCVVVLGYSEHYRCRIEVLHHERQRTHFVGSLSRQRLLSFTNTAGIASSVHPAFVISDQAPSKNSRELRW